MCEVWKLSRAWIHRRHKDGNSLNNSIENLELLCPECHRATLREVIINHRKREEKIPNNLNRLIDECFAGKISGAVVERLIKAMKCS
jgi:5-methylcytosine-specific restriction endonuclease McrA